MIAFICAVIIHVAVAEPLGVTIKNNSSVDLFKNEKYLRAFEGFAGLLEDMPDNSLIQMNLGTAMAANGDEEKSRQLFVYLEKHLREKGLAGLSKVEQSVYVSSLYNLGTLYVLKKEVDLALEWYQKALRHMPDSTEIKINIELLMQQKSGKGKGDSKDDSQSQSGDGEGESSSEDQEQKEQPSQGNQKKKQDGEGEKKPQEMSRQDLKRIMDELKAQENKIRAKLQDKENRKNKKEKDKDNGKNW